MAWLNQSFMFDQYRGRIAQICKDNNEIDSIFLTVLLFPHELISRFDVVQAASCLYNANAFTIFMEVTRCRSEKFATAMWSS